MATPVQIDRHERAVRWKRWLKRWTSKLYRRLRKKDPDADLKRKYKGYTG